MVVIGGTMMPGKAIHGDTGCLLSLPSQTRVSLTTQAGAAPTAPADNQEAIMSDVSDVPFFAARHYQFAEDPAAGRDGGKGAGSIKLGDRVYLRWPELDDETKLHHSAKRMRPGRVVQVLVGVQFEDEVEPMYLPSGQWSRAAIVE